MINKKIYYPIQIAVLAAIMVILSFISIPLGPVPITLENLGVMLAALLLGSKRGTLAIVLFILLKVIGLGGPGGLLLLVGPTCGYVYGWLLIPFFTNVLMKLFHRHLNFWSLFLILAVVNVVIVDYLGGSLGLMIVNHFKLTGALVYNCLFVPGDVVKALVATLVYHSAMRSDRFRNLLK